MYRNFKKSSSFSKCFHSSLKFVFVVYILWFASWAVSKQIGNISTEAKLQEWSCNSESTRRSSFLEKLMVLLSVKKFTEMYEPKFMTMFETARQFFSILSQMNPGHVASSRFFKLCFSVILTTKPSSSKSYFSFMFPQPEVFKYFYSPPCEQQTYPTPSSLIWSPGKHLAMSIYQNVPSYTASSIFLFPPRLA